MRISPAKCHLALGEIGAYLSQRHDGFSWGMTVGRFVIGECSQGRRLRAFARIPTRLTEVKGFKIIDSRDNAL
jgi:hypothetical protein